MSCAVPGCTNNRRFKPSGVSFHRFPQDEFLDVWLEVLCKDLLNSWVWSKNKFVCSLHFRPDDYITYGNNKRILKINAVPSILPTRKVKYPAQEQTSEDDIAKPTTSKDASLESSVAHFVVKPKYSLEENEISLNEDPKNYNPFNSGVKPDGVESRRLGYNSIIVSSILPGNSKATSSAYDTSDETNICTYGLNKYNTVTKRSHHGVYVLNEEVAASWPMGSFNEFGEESDPLVVEACTSTVSLDQPKPKPSQNTLNIKSVKKILKRKLWTIDAAVATTPTRKDIKANVNMKRLTGLSLPFFTELLSLYDEGYHPRNRQMIIARTRLLLFLVKLKWGTSFTTLSSFFQVNPFSAVRLFRDGLNTVYDISQEWLAFCSQSAKKSTVTCSRFKVMIDCFEVLTECPKYSAEDSLLASINTERCTYKFLIGVASTGSIAFVSRAQGGHSSKAMVLEGISPSLSSCIQAGDLVAVGRGCPELESVIEEMGAVAVPFSFEDSGVVELAACRHRFERTIQKLKRFEILKLVTSDLSSEIDKIVYVCCVLLNHKILKPNRRNM